MLISLIVPVYNLERYLHETFASIVAARQALGADASEVEVVFVDDGSTDGSGRLLDDFARREGAVVIHKPNGGEGSARNTGIERSTGERLMYLDGDDVLLPNALTEAVRLSRMFPQTDVIGMRYAVFADGEPVSVGQGEKTVRLFDMRQSVPAELVRTLGVFPTLFRRAAFGGLSFSDLPLGADREYVLSALALARSAVVSDAVVEGYRVREGSMARARWTVRKVRSLNDHAVRGLAALASSGKRVEPAGAGYVAALVVSEVPARLARLGDVDGVQDLWRHWMSSVRGLPTPILPLSVRILRRLVLTVGRSRCLSVAVARTCRALNVA